MIVATLGIWEFPGAHLAQYSSITVNFDLLKDKVKVVRIFVTVDCANKLKGRVI